MENEIETLEQELLSTSIVTSNTRVDDRIVG